MARRLRRRRARSVSLLTIGGVLGGLGYGVGKATDGFSNMGPHGEYVVNGLGEAVLGYDFINKKLSLDSLAAFYGFSILGYVGHKIMNVIGVNRKMPRRWKL
ncbi:MAG: hypothetical protein QW429_03920 [Thermoprotei archaeon]